MGHPSRGCVCVDVRDLLEALPKRLELAEHGVERHPELADLGAPLAGAHPLGEIAGGDRTGGVGHRLQRPQPPPQQQPGAGGEQRQEGEPGRAFDEEEAAQGRAHLRGRHGDDDGVAGQPVLAERALLLARSLVHARGYDAATIEEAEAWYAKTFGGVVNTHANEPVVDVPGAQIRFAKVQTAQAPTKGRVLAASDALATLPWRDPERVEVGQRTSKPLWDNWKVLALLCLVVGAEWTLRRRWGYA